MSPQLLAESFAPIPRHKKANLGRVLYFRYRGLGWRVVVQLQLVTNVGTSAHNQV